MAPVQCPRVRPFNGSDRQTLGETMTFSREHQRVGESVKRKKMRMRSGKTTSDVSPCPEVFATETVVLRALSYNISVPTSLDFAQ
eukprot:4066-Pyramimonas_sp.AAC.1